MALALSMQVRPAAAAHVSTSCKLEEGVDHRRAVWCGSSCAQQLWLWTCDLDGIRTPCMDLHRPYASLHGLRGGGAASCTLCACTPGNRPPRSTPTYLTGSTPFTQFDCIFILCAMRMNLCPSLPSGRALPLPCRTTGPRMVPSSLQQHQPQQLQHQHKPQHHLHLMQHQQQGLEGAAPTRQTWLPSWQQPCSQSRVRGRGSPAGVVWGTCRLCWHAPTAFCCC